MFATGDELMPPGAELGPGQIVSSNNFALGALARAEGAAVEDLGIVGDRSMTRSPRCGAPARRRGHSHHLGRRFGRRIRSCQKAFTAEGMELSFWRLRCGRAARDVRPARRNACARVPGNPVSAFVCGFLFLVPLIRCLAGRTDLEAPTTKRSSVATYPKTTSVPIICARRCRGTKDRWRPLPGPGQLDDGAAGESGLHGDPGTLRAGGEGRQRLFNLKFER